MRKKAEKEQVSAASAENEEMPDGRNGADAVSAEEHDAAQNKTAEEQPQSADNLSAEELLERMETLEKENEQAKDTLLRKVAELENVKKRTRREIAASFEDAKIRAFTEFLPVYDDLLRAVEAGYEESTEDNFFQGVKLVLSKFEDILKRHQIEVIDEVNIPFDVDLHDALLRQPSKEENTPSNTVLQILERGYRMGSRIISHAKVIVSE